jgi:hypothetical protein
MKNLILLFAAALIISCAQDAKTKNGASANGTESANAETEKLENAELVAHPMIDNKGQIMGQMTFPANWRLHNEPGKAAFTGPNGVFVYNIPMCNFMFTNDQMMKQSYAQNGGKLRAPVSGEDLVRQDLEPIARKEGSKLTKVYRSAEIAKSDASVQDMMYRIGPTNTRYDAIVSEWQDKNGNPYAMILHISVTDMGNMIMWNYYGQGLDAPKDRYESAKNILLDGLASLQYNPRYFDQYNQNEMNRESHSWAAHSQKMNARQQQFDAQQQAFKQKSEAINSSIMASYNERNASSDRSHNRFVNYIKDENTVVNKQDGNRYQVQAGANQYWTNDQGQYIGTNDPNYDPNRNQETQNQSWSEAQMTD